MLQLCLGPISPIIFDDVFFISLIALMCGVIQVSFLPSEKLLLCLEACKHNLLTTHFLSFWTLLQICSCILKTHLFTAAESFFFLNRFVTWHTSASLMKLTYLPCSLLFYTLFIFPNVNPQLLLIQI